MKRLSDTLTYRGIASEAVFIVPSVVGAFRWTTYPYLRLAIDCTISEIYLKIAANFAIFSDPFTVSRLTVKFQKQPLMYWITVWWKPHDLSSVFVENIPPTNVTDRRTYSQLLPRSAEQLTSGKTLLLYWTDWTVLFAKSESRHWHQWGTIEGNIITFPHGNIINLSLGKYCYIQ